ncbi:MAG: hypothetical protein V1837_04030 [Candidatus Woesearchaeota archaeon]
MEKRGQITIFIIIGIIMLIAAAIFYFSWARTTEQPIQVEQVRALQLAEPAQQVKTYVEQCLSDYANSGIEILGLQAGFIYIPTELQTTGISGDRTVVKTGSMIQVIDATGKNKVPYWITEDSISVPSTDYMQNELARYITENLPRCTDFEVFRKKSYVIKTGTINTTVRFGKQATIDLHWPIQITQNEKQYEVDNYNYQVDVNLALIHEIAMELVTREFADTYLEDHAKSLISLYSYTGAEKGAKDLPPFSFSDSSTDCKYVTWTKDEVKENLEGILSKNFPYLKMAGTKFERVISNDASVQGVYDSFIRNYFENLSSISVEFSYPAQSDNKFDIKPTSGNVISPDKESQTSIPFLPSFCIYDYRFKYFLTHPVVIKITDSDSAKIIGNLVQEKQGFSFYFPMQLFLCGNQNRQCTGQNPYSEVNLTAFFGSETMKSVFDCNNVSTQASVVTTNETGLLPGVGVRFQCNNTINECDAGETASSGRASLKLPKCAGLQLKLQKAGYSTIVDAVKSEYKLEKLKNYSIEVELVLARKFLENYYLTNGYLRSSCGKTPEEMLQETRYQPRPKDEITISINGASANPTVLYPTMKSMIIGSGNYRVGMLAKGNVVIKPSTYKEGDNTVTVDFDNNPLTHSNYEGPWIIGNGNFGWKATSLRGSKIKFYCMVDFLSDQNLEVNSITETVIDGSRLSGKITVDDNCDGKTKQVDYTVNDYSQFVAPEVS